jgi:fructuronate reductase
VVVEALARRKAAGLPAFSVMSCDNMPENGHVMRNVTCAYARAVDGELADWIESHVTFPSTMVDRIVPAVTPTRWIKLNSLPACAIRRRWPVNRSVSG